MIWTFEVRQDLQRNGSHIGRSIVEKLVAEHRDREIYVGSAPGAIGFWSQLDWSMCGCGDCDNRGFLVR
jgi:signal transduction histidine kinase